MKQLPQVSEYSYVNDMLPELIWLGLIHDRAGYRFGSRVLELVVEATKGLPVSQKSCNFALQACYANLPDAIKSSIVRHWEQADMLETIRDAISPLILLYEGCPLAFVGSPLSSVPHSVLVTRIKESVANHLDKRETPAVVLHGAMLLTRLMAGTVRFASHIVIPDLNAVVDAPGSEESTRAAGFMRSSAAAEWAMLEVSNDWARHFWNRNARLSPCEPPDYLSEDD